MEVGLPAETTTTTTPAPPQPVTPIDYAPVTAPPPWYVSYRWLICALLFFATTINYVDRSVLGVLAPTLRKEIGWSDSQYGQISAAFTLAYAIGFLFAGWFIDRFGTRIGYAVYVIIWSFAAAGHALASTAFGFGAAR